MVNYYELHVFSKASVLSINATILYTIFTQFHDEMRRLLEDDNPDIPRPLLKRVVPLAQSVCPGDVMVFCPVWLPLHRFKLE